MICRLCLIKLNPENSVSLFNEFDSADAPHLLTIIAKYLHLLITWDDEISTNICSKCSQHLREFDKYCVFIKEQQIKLSQEVPSAVEQNVEPKKKRIKREVDKDKVAEKTQVQLESHKNIVKMKKVIKCETDEDIVSKEIQIQSEPDKDVTKKMELPCEPAIDAIVTKKLNLQCELNERIEPKEMQLKCEPEKTEIHEMVFHLDTESVLQSSATSSHSEYSSSTLFHQAYTQFILNSSELDIPQEPDAIINSDEPVEYIPDATSIKQMLPIQEIYQVYSMGHPLEQNDRLTIANTIIEACLMNKPGNIITRENFEKLAANITEVFPTELESTYYKPSCLYQNATGKLVHAYRKRRYRRVKRVKVQLLQKPPITSTVRWISQPKP